MHGDVQAAFVFPLWRPEEQRPGSSAEASAEGAVHCLRQHPNPLRGEWGMGDVGWAGPGCMNVAFVSVYLWCIENVCTKP